MAEKVAVEIIGDHPHAGSKGTIDPDAPRLAGMVRITLLARDASGASACYADPKNYRLVRSS